MRNLYCYEGTVSEMSREGRDIKLWDSRDIENKAPVRLEAFGGLAKYINDIEWTDAEERYIASKYYYDSNLFLKRIEVPSTDGRIPAKIIAVKDVFASKEVTIFGPKDYIETDRPEPMSWEEYHAWLEWKVEHQE